MTNEQFNQNIVRKLLQQLARTKGYVLNDSLDTLTRKLSAGSAVDSIFYAETEDALEELRVWFQDFELVTPDGTIASLS